MLNLLKLIFGRDTRGTQMLNVYTHLIWLVMIFIYYLNNTQVRFIAGILEHIQTLTTMIILLVIVAVASLCCEKEQHQLLKVFGLLLGSCVQMIISSGYVKAYPPLDTMSIFSVSLSVWFAGAVVYIIKIEGFKDGSSRGNKSPHDK